MKTPLTILQEKISKETLIPKNLKDALFALIDESKDLELESIRLAYMQGDVDGFAEAGNKKRNYKNANHYINEQYK